MLTRIDRALDRTERRTRCERGSSSLEMVMLLPFVAMVFMILVGLGYALGTKQHALVAARFASTYDVAKHVTPTPALVGHAASSGTETWVTSVTRVEPPAFIPFLSSFDSSGTATGVSGSTPARGIIPHLYPSIPAASARFMIPTTTSTCRELGGSSYLTYILNQGGVGEIFGTASDDCCNCYTAD